MIVQLGRLNVLSNLCVVGLRLTRRLGFRDGQYRVSKYSILRNFFDPNDTIYVFTLAIYIAR